MAQLQDMATMFIVILTAQVRREATDTAMLCRLECLGPDRVTVVATLPETYR